LAVVWLGCRRRAALVGEEVGVLERPTSGQEAQTALEYVAPGCFDYRFGARFGNFPPPPGGKSPKFEGRWRTLSLLFRPSEQKWLSSR
jgi:hypothetical protein